MIEITLQISITERPHFGADTVYTKKNKYHEVPRKGDRVYFTHDSWSEEVEEVWWNTDGTVDLSFKHFVRDCAGEEMVKQTNNIHNRLAYMGEEDYEALLEAGWKKF
jgi:hypothetical protein